MGKEKKSLLGKVGLGIVCLVLLTGCSFSRHSKTPEATRVAEVRNSLVPPKEVTLEIPRKELQQALERQLLLQKARFVVVTRSQEEMEKAPEYRMFQVEEGSVYKLFGLQNGDVLVAADDYIVYDPAVMPNYFAIKSTQDQAKLLIRRGEEEIEMKYRIVG